MEMLLPTQDEIKTVNASRAETAHNMATRKRFEFMRGPCSLDDLIMPTGELATVRHLTNLGEGVQAREEIDEKDRLNGEKPRTHRGATGIIHTANGPVLYAQTARGLVLAGHQLTAEIMSETGLAIMGPWLTSAWSGKRNAEDTNTRYLLRHTEEAEAQGIHPLPAFVKNNDDRRLETTICAVDTIMSPKREPRTRLGLTGLKNVVTLANPHVGVILRGNASLTVTENVHDDILNEVGEAREILDEKFGRDRIPLIFDISHLHAKQRGGGEAGQLIVGYAIVDLLKRGLLQPLGVLGMMAETYIRAGKQKERGMVAGLSRTDECIRERKVLALRSALNSALATEVRVAA